MRCVPSINEIGIEDLPPELRRSGAGLEKELALTTGTWSEALERGRAEAGKRYLEAVLRRFGGQVTEAAVHAGVERESCYRLLRIHGVDPVNFRTDPGSSRSTDV